MLLFFGFKIVEHRVQIVIESRGNASRAARTSSTISSRQGIIFSHQLARRTDDRGIKTIVSHHVYQATLNLSIRDMCTVPGQQILAFINGAIAMCVASVKAFAGNEPSRMKQAVKHLIVSV